MEIKCYYKECATNAGRKCVVTFIDGYEINLIAYVGRARVNYYMYVENLFGSSRAVPVTASWLSRVYPEPFRMLKIFAGVRWYRGV